MNAKFLLYGYGNPGRQDDGLGIALVDLVEQKRMHGVDCDRNYQLNIEDALKIADYEAVIFVDASLDARSPYEFSRIAGSHEIAFTTHAMSAQSIIALCEELYNKSPRAYMLAIRGYEWEAAEGLSPQAASNLEKAYELVSMLLSKLSSEALEEAAGSVATCKV